MKKTAGSLVLIIVCICAFPLYGQEKESEPWPVGFLFNISSLQNPLESYQGGVGIKFLTEKVNLRFLLDIYYDQQTETSMYSIGLALEKHLNKTHLSPYFGFSTQIGYTIEQYSHSADNWTRHDIIPLEAGPIFGVEVFLTEYLSFFAEYYAGFSYRLSTTTTSAGGTETKVEKSFFAFNTGIGNNAKIGLTIYLENQVAMPKRK